jgi:glycosyltransferase involved in cell wall biosynthesis
MSSPELSVVVATHNRGRRLEALLRSLAAQEGPAIEVVVVDDGSTDGTPELLGAGLPGLELRALRHHPPRGPAAARNAGWREARAPLVAFVDDDVVAEPGFAAALVDAARRSEGVFFQGRTRHDPQELGRATVFWRSMRVEDVDPGFPTCNIAYPRELLERLGGFDESFRRPAGEDTDLGWRARNAGFEPRFVPEALVSHAVLQIGLVGMLRDAQRLADNADLFRRHPGLRSNLHRHVFWNPAHERLLGTLAGVALARRTRGASLMLGLPYALFYRPHHRGWLGTLASMPGYVLIDLAQMASLARGSARHGALVL